MGIQRLTPQGRHGVTRAALQACLALLILLLPVLDVHADTTLEPIAPGTPVATAGVHPEAAAHVEASGTEITPRCPACDLAHQSAGALSQAVEHHSALCRELGTAAGHGRRSSTPFAPALLRGPPSL